MDTNTLEEALNVLNDDTNDPSRRRYEDDDDIHAWEKRYGAFMEKSLEEALKVMINDTNDPSRRRSEDDINA